jgi:hypothetical protein
MKKTGKYGADRVLRLYAILWVFLESLCCTPSYWVEVTISDQVLKDIQVINVKAKEYIHKDFNALIASEYSSNSKLTGYSVYISRFGIPRDKGGNKYYNKSVF